MMIVCAADPPGWSLCGAASIDTDARDNAHNFYLEGDGGVGVFVVCLFGEWLRYVCVRFFFRVLCNQVNTMYDVFRFL